MSNVITVTDLVMLRKLGFDYPIPTYISAVPSMLLKWLTETNPSLSEGEKYALIGDMYRYDQEERSKPHTIEHRVARQNDEYSTISYWVATVEKRDREHMQKWLADPEYKAALHKHDSEFK